jgi:acetate kinase
MSVILVVNPGSTSKKYALYHDRQVLLSHRFETTMSGFEVCLQDGSGAHTCEIVSHEEYQLSFERVAKDLRQTLKTHRLSLDAISIRVVAPGSDFQRHQLITPTFITKLRDKEMSVPTHIPHIMQEIQSIKNAFPDIQLVAASDSAFHVTLPKKAREFSIDRSDAETYDIHRFGYHGLSVASVVRRIHPVTGVNSVRTVVVHIGGGVSVTAVKDNQSVDTTMGYAPSSGLPMGSRAGDLDAGGLLQLMRAKNLKPSEAEMYLNTKGGLYGLSELADIRHLLDRHARGDAVSKQTLDLFVYRIQKHIGAAVVALGGIDMLVLTGTACTRSSELRSLIVSGLECFDITLDEERNLAHVGQDGIISIQNAEVKVVTIRTDEMGEMAQVVELLDFTQSKT